MKYQTRKIISNSLLIIESVLLFAITLMLILKITVFNKSYVIKKIDQNYYENMYNETIDLMKYIARKKGYKEYFVENIFTTNDIKKDTKQFVDAFFNEKNVEINTDSIKSNLNKNIEEYEKTKEKKYDETEKNKFVDKITSTYKNEIRLLKTFDDYSNSFNKYNKLNNSLLLITILDLAILVIINKKIFKKEDYQIILLSSGISLSLTFIYTKIINLKNIFIYNENVSRIIRKIFINSTNISLIFIVIYIITGIYLIRKKKEN